MDLESGCFAGRGVELPDGKVALENNRPSVARNRRPEDSARCQGRDAPRLTAERHRPKILVAVAIGHEPEALSVGRPHGPDFFRAIGCELFVHVRRWIAKQINLRLIDVTSAVPPPLSRRDSSRGESD